MRHFKQTVVGLALVGSFVIVAAGPSAAAAGIPLSKCISGGGVSGGDGGGGAVCSGGTFDGYDIKVGG